MNYETGESSSRSSEGRKSREKEKSMGSIDAKDETNDKHNNEHKHKHHHRREKSKHDLEKNKTKDEENEERKDKSLRREKSKSREQIKHKDDIEDEYKDKDKEVDKGRKSSNSSRGLERRDSKRKDSARHIRHASELPIAMDHESTAFIKEFARNMDLLHHKSEPDLRPFVEEIKAQEKKPSEGRSSKQKKVHPAIALIKSAISSRIAALAKDREEKQRVRETSHRLRRHTVTEAATLFNYEPRGNTPTTPTTPRSASSATPTYVSVPATAPPSTPITDPSPAESPETIPDSEDGDDERDCDSPDVVIEKSYTPDLMQYADVDLAPHLSFSVGVN